MVKKVSEMLSKEFITNKQINIIGIGNTLYSDEGVGVHLIPYLNEVLPEIPNIEIIEGNTDGMKLLGPVEDADYLIIIDAINAGKKPGTVITIRDEEIPKYFGVKMSIHQIGFQEILFAARLRDKLPEKMVMFGVQPESFELGLELSETVKNKVPEVVNLVVEQIRHWSE